MQQYNKYIFSRILGPMALITISLTGIGILVISESLKLTDLIVNKGLDVITFLHMISLQLPTILWFTIPISLFISILFAYSKLSNESELIIFQAAGMSKIALMKPVIFFAIAMTFFSYIVSLLLLPATHREFKDLQVFLRNNYASALLQEEVFTNITKGLTIYIKERDDNNVMRNIIIHDTREEGKSVTMLAQNGKLAQSTSGPSFLLTNGNRQEINRETGELSLLHFERYALELSLFDTDINKNRWREPKERYLGDLLNPTDTTEPRLIRKLKAEAHNRLTWPLYNILFAIIALIPFIGGEFRRSGQGKKVLVATTLAIAAIIVDFATIGATAKRLELAPSIYIVIVVEIIIALYIATYDRKTYRDFFANILRKIREA